MMVIKPSEQFKQDFNLCMQHYECTQEEAKFERDRILANEQAYYDAAICYSVIAAGIRKGFLK